MVDYEPMTLAKLAAFVAAERDFDTRWRLVVEFLKEYHHEPGGERQALLEDEPAPTGDERWMSCSLALPSIWPCGTGGARPPGRHPGACCGSGSRLAHRARGAQALVHAPAALRRRGVFVADYEIDAA